MRHFPSPSRLAFQVTILAAFRFTRSVAAGIISLVFPYLVLRTLHYGPLQLGLIYGAAAIATAGLGLLVGILADIWGRKETLLLVAAMLPLSSYLALRAHSLPWLFAAAIVGGYSATGSLAGGGVGGAAQPIQNAVVADITDAHNRTFFFSLFSFVSGVCAAAGSLLAHAFSIREAFLAATWIAAAGTLILFAAPLPRPPRGRVRAMRSMKVVGQFSVTGALNGFSQGLITPFLIPFFVIVYRTPKNQMAVFAFISGLAASCALWAAPWIERRLGFVRGVSWSRGTGAALLLLLPFWRYFPAAVAIYLVTPGLRVMALPAQQTALTEMVPAEETGRALGVNQVTRLGASAGAIGLTGYSFAALDFALPFVLYAALTLANIGLYFRFFGARPEGRPKAARGEE